MFDKLNNALKGGNELLSTIGQSVLDINNINSGNKETNTSVPVPAVQSKTNKGDNFMNNVRKYWIYIAVGVIVFFTYKPIKKFLKKKFK